MPNTEIAETLTRWRSEAQLQQHQVTAALSRVVTRQMISHWEKGVSMPYAQDIREIGAVCGIGLREVERLVAVVASERGKPVARSRRHGKGERVE
jgi:transcriptional regulator with XRE-family HTH domain